MLFHRPDRFPYSTEHLGRRVAWVVAQLRAFPAPGPHACAIDLEDRLSDLQDVESLRSALGRLERDLDHELYDHRAEIKYIRIHLRRKPVTDQVNAFLRGYYSSSNN